MITRLIPVALLGVMLAVAFFLQGAAAADSGMLEVRIKDHREAIGDFSRFTLRLAAIRVSPRAGLALWKRGWLELRPGLPSIDLTKYTGRESAVVFSGSVTAGNFDGIAVDVAGTEAVLKKSGKPAAVKTVITPLKLGFPVEPGGKTVVIIDLVVFDMSDHPPRGYELSVRGYEVWVNGKARDKVPPA